MNSLLAFLYHASRNASQCPTSTGVSVLYQCMCVCVGGASHLAFCHSSWMSLCISVAVLIVVHGTGVCGGSFVYVYPML